MRWFRWLIRSIVLAAVLLVLWYGCTATYLVYITERDYLSARYVLDLVDDYVAERGAWPKSWHDLEQFSQSESLDWPKLQQRVAVDFDVKLNELASQSVHQFKAIRPIRPNEVFDDDDLRRVNVEPLLRTVRQLTNAREKGSERFKKSF